LNNVFHARTVVTLRGMEEFPQEHAVQRVLSNAGKHVSEKAKNFEFRAATSRECAVAAFTAHGMKNAEEEEEEAGTVSVANMLSMLAHGDYEQADGLLEAASGNAGSLG